MAAEWYTGRLSPDNSFGTFMLTDTKCLSAKLY